MRQHTRRILGSCAATLFAGTTVRGQTATIVDTAPFGLPNALAYHGPGAKQDPNDPFSPYVAMDHSLISLSAGPTKFHPDWGTLTSATLEGTGSSNYQWDLSTAGGWVWPDSNVVTATVGFGSPLNVSDSGDDNVIGTATVTVTSTTPNGDPSSARGGFSPNPGVHSLISPSNATGYGAFNVPVFSDLSYYIYAPRIDQNTLGDLTGLISGMFIGQITATYTFTPTNPWTPPNPPPPPGGGTGVPISGGGWGGNPLPNAPCAVVYFGDNAAGSYDIALDVPVTWGTVFFNSTHSYTISGPNTLTIDCTDARINVSGGSHTISAPIHFASSALLSVANAGDTLTLSGTMTSASTSVLTKTGAGTVLAKHVRAAGLDVRQGKVQVIANNSATGTSVVGALSVNDAAGATFDLARNHLVVDYGTGATSPFAEVARLIKVGYNNGDWQGAGLTSSDAAAVHAAIAAGSGGYDTALGYAEASALGVTTFGGQTVDADAVLVRYTLAGDANLDGLVNFSDLLTLARNYNGTGKSWADGDFNYDGVVNFSDQLVLARNYNQSIPADPAFALAVVGAPVPEPASVTLLLLASGALTLRRRRPRRA